LSQREEIQKEITKSIFKIEDLERFGMTEELQRAKDELEYK